MHALLDELFERNGVDHDDLISILFTATDDIHSMFPATAARTLGLGDVPLIGAQELDVTERDEAVHPRHDAPDAPSVHAELHHVYLEGAKGCATTSRTTDRPAAPANVIGTGLIGGSIGLALRQRGWRVIGSDASDATLARGPRARCARRGRARRRRPTITFVATPVAAIAEHAASCARGRVRGASPTSAA